AGLRYREPTSESGTCATTRSPGTSSTASSASTSSTTRSRTSRFKRSGKNVANANPSEGGCTMENERRRFLVSTAALGMMGVGAVAAARGADKKDEEEVGATEDLMREHGVLNRVLLIYEEGLRRLHAKEEVGPEVFHRTATLVRKFVEDYHEKLE